MLDGRQKGEMLHGFMLLRKIDEAGKSSEYGSAKWLHKIPRQRYSAETKPSAPNQFLIKQTLPASIYRHLRRNEPTASLCHAGEIARAAHHRSSIRLEIFHDRGAHGINEGVI